MYRTFLSWMNLSPSSCVEENRLWSNKCKFLFHFISLSSIVFHFNCISAQSYGTPSLSKCSPNIELEKYDCFAKQIIVLLKTWDDGKFYTMLQTFSKWLVSKVVGIASFNPFHKVPASTSIYAEWNCYNILIFSLWGLPSCRIHEMRGSRKTSW